MLRLHTILSAASISLFAFQAAAVRLDFEVLHAGAPVGSAEICAYKSPGLGGNDPVSKYFADNDVHCLPALLC